MRLFLIGGSGLLGSHVAERLRARGDEVLCLQRGGSDTAFLERLGCRIVTGDVTGPPDGLADAMAGADAVVHAAALVYRGRSWEEVSAVNVRGTGNVVGAAARAGVPRVVHVSSVAVYGPGQGAGDGGGEPREGPGASSYGRSKHEAEAAARAAASPTMRLTVLRPAALYGERDRLLAPRLARVLRLPVVPLLGPGRNTVPVVYAGNAADALVLVLDRAPGGEVFDLGLDHPLTQRELLEGFAAALGRRTRCIPVPAGVVRAAVRGAGRAGLGLPGAADLALDRFLALTLGENPYGSARIRDELGWDPPFTHLEGFTRTAAWLRTGG